jgi:hypothetical protein
LHVRTANHLGAIRAIRVGFDDSERICACPHCKFLHKPLGMLNGSWRRRFLRMRAAKTARAERDRSRNDMRETLMLSMFSTTRKKSHVISLDCAMRCARSVACARQHATSGVAARASTLHCAKTLVFLSRCSNSNGVFAIPAGTVRHRHSLMARRAAWRRSERRRRSQRRKRAQGRPSAGRRSNHALLPSLRLRTTSMTASNGPARVEQR